VIDTDLRDHLCDLKRLKGGCVLENRAVRLVPRRTCMCRWANDVRADGGKELERKRVLGCDDRRNDLEPATGT